MKKKTKNHWDVKDVLFEWEKAAAGALQHQHLLKKKTPVDFFQRYFLQTCAAVGFCVGGEKLIDVKNHFFLSFSFSSV